MASKKQADEVKDVATEEVMEEVVAGEAQVPEAEADSTEAVEASADEAAEADEHFTKAGKRSKKAVAEAEAEVERKAAAAEHHDEAPVKARVVHVPNTKKHRGKGYMASLEQVDKTKEYELGEALALAKATARVKFDAAVELHVNLGVDPRQADQVVRASVVLPHGTGKTLRVAVLTDDAALQTAAKKAGADVVGGDDLLATIEKGQLDFDQLVATPAMMPKLGKLAKVLGPKGLMPSPKSGTVTDDVATAVTQAKAGKVEFRVDKQAIVHQLTGRVSFSDEQLVDNTLAVVAAIMRSKPAGAKGTYVKSMALTTSMGPGIKLAITSTIKASSGR